MKGGGKKMQPRIYLKLNAAPEDFAAELTMAAYEVALRHGIKGSFLDFEMALFATLGEMIRKQTRVVDRSGLIIPD